MDWQLSSPPINLGSRAIISHIIESDTFPICVTSIHVSRRDVFFRQFVTIILRMKIRKNTISSSRCNEMNLELKLDGFALTRTIRPATV